MIGRTREYWLSERPVAWPAGHALVMLGALGCAVAGASGVLALAGLVSFGALLWNARAGWTPSGSFGLANAITCLRLVLSAAIGCGRTQPPLLLAASIVLVLLIDGLDGLVARTRGEASAFGARFDMESDAFFVLTTSYLVFATGRAGSWVLICGVWRYAYVLVLALRRAVQRDAPRNRLARYVFAIVVLALAATFTPLPHAEWLALFATGLLSWSFVRSLVWSLRSV